MKSLHLALILGAVGGLSLSGCGSGEHEDIKQWMHEASKDLRGKLPPLPELVIPPIVSYNAADRPDPFGMGRFEPERGDTGGGKRPDLTRPLEDLERFPLETLKFVGIVSNAKNRERHVLVLANGVLFKANKGNYLGQNFGRIIEITDKNEIVIIETVKDPSGQSNDWVEKTRTLQLQDDTMGKEAGK
jgi:type IV pilus assembly protein PilP